MVVEGFVGRRPERDRLRTVLRAVADGRGGAVLVEGEPGIGKSSLLAAGLADATAHGCELAWAAADELSQRFPLRVMLDCLGVGGYAPHPDSGVERQRGEVASALRSGRSVGLLADGNPVRAASELLIALVERWCGGTPLVLVVDDLQWADDASLAVWRRLAGAVDQLPLLLAGAYRAVPRRGELDRLREAVRAGDGLVLRLGPLSGPETTELLAELVGAEPDPELRRLAERTAGNPMYLHELVVAGRDGDPPGSLTAAVTRRLRFLTPAVTEALQIGALLGVPFTVDDVAAVLGRPARDLALPIDEALTLGVLVRSAGRLAFRHALVRHVLYDGMPAGVRVPLHAHAAHALWQAGARPVDVAAQLAALADLPDGWMYDWLAGAARQLLDEAPLIAEDLLRRAVDQVAADDPRRPDFAATLADLLLRLGRNADAETYARSAIVPGGDPDRTSRMRWVIAYLLMRTGRGAEAAAGLAEALGDPELPDRWRARLLALVAMMQAAGGDDVDAAEERARQALALGEVVGDRFAVGCALQALSIGYAIRRDEARRLECVDRALDVLGDDPDCTDLRLLHLANRLYSLSILDRMAEAEETLVTLRELAERFGDARLASLHHPAATLHFFRGRWDDALAELDAISDVPEDAAVTGMVHGLAALIAARRDDREAAAAHLAAVRDEPLDTPRARANGLPLLTARAVTAERDGDPAAALAVLRPLLDDEWAQSERHLLLPELARLAVGLDDSGTAQRALAVCAAVAAADPTASRRAAVDRCRGQVDSDPDPVLAAAAHYRAVGRVAELATALEDAAVLLARRGDEPAARAVFGEAVEIYAKLGALWDQRRADARIRRYGIRRGTRGPRNRPRYGWESLSPTELMIADLVAKGASNPDIAAELLLSRRTVQSHVSHILQKLNVRSRVEIARETVAHSARS